MVIFEDFLVLELNKRGVGITFAVILREDSECFFCSTSCQLRGVGQSYFIFLPILVDKPSRALREEQDADGDHGGKSGLDNCRSPPRPRILDVPAIC